MQHEHSTQQDGASLAARAGACVLTILGGAARQVDDVGRALIGCSDELSRGVIYQSDDLLRLANRAGDELPNQASAISRFLRESPDDAAGLLKNAADDGLPFACERSSGSFAKLSFEQACKAAIQSSIEEE